MVNLLSSPFSIQRALKNSNFFIVNQQGSKTSIFKKGGQFIVRISNNTFKSKIYRNIKTNFNKRYSFQNLPQTIRLRPFCVFYQKNNSYQIKKISQIRTINQAIRSHFLSLVIISGLYNY